MLGKNKIEEATPIQEKSIPKILKGEDLIGKAQTGTGKTLAFLLPVFEKLNVEDKRTQALIIAPTRELALQISNEAEKLREYKRVNITTVYGGASIETQIRKLKKGSQLVIGTPGRIVDLIKRRKLVLENINQLVFDEADEIMNMGFMEDVEFIIAKTPKKRQTLLFSATMPKSIKSVSKTATKNPVMVEVEDIPLTAGQIEEVKIQTTDRKKYDDLVEYLEKETPYMAIIFCRTKMRVKNLTEKLREEGYSVDEIHGDLNQNKRERALKKFRNLKTRYLIATDVAARGLDIEGVSHVINYDEPERQAEYVHRIGRTGRAKEKGTAVTFVVQKDSENRKRRSNSKNSRNRNSNKNNDKKDFRSGDKKDFRSGDKRDRNSKFDGYKKGNNKSKRDHRSFDKNESSEGGENRNYGSKSRSNSGSKPRSNSGSKPNSNSSYGRNNKKSNKAKDLIK